MASKTDDLRAAKAAKKEREHRLALALLETARRQKGGASADQDTLDRFVALQENDGRPSEVLSFTETAANLPRRTSEFSGDRFNSRLEVSDGNTCDTISGLNRTMKYWSRFDSPARVSLSRGGSGPARSVQGPSTPSGASGAQTRKGGAFGLPGVAVRVFLRDSRIVDAERDFTDSAWVVPGNKARNPIVFDLPFGGDLSVQYMGGETAPRGAEIDVCIK